MEIERDGVKLVSNSSVVDWFRETAKREGIKKKYLIYGKALEEEMYK